MQLIVLLPLVLQLLVQLLDLNLLTVHLCQVGPQTNLTRQVSNLSVFPLNIVSQSIELRQQILEILRVLL